MSAQCVLICAYICENECRHNTTSFRSQSGVVTPTVIDGDAVMLSCDPLLLLLQIHIHKPWKNGTFMANSRCHAIFLVSRIVVCKKERAVQTIQGLPPVFLGQLKTEKSQWFVFRTIPGPCVLGSTSLTFCPGFSSDPCHLSYKVVPQFVS